MKPEELNLDTLPIKNLLRNAKLKKYMAVIFAGGIVLMAFSDKIQKPPSENFGTKTAMESQGVADTDVDISQRDTEKRLEELFGNIDGTGNVKVMITYKSGPEKVVATETKSSEESSQESDTDGTERTSKNVSSEVKMAYSQNDMSSGEPFIVKEKTPEIEGIVVVAEGGDDIIVKDAISKAAQALFNVPAHKVEVLKMGV